MEFEYALEEFGIYKKIEKIGNRGVIPVEMSLNGDREKIPLIMIKVPYEIMDFFCSVPWVDHYSCSNIDSSILYLNLNDGAGFKPEENYLVHLTINQENLILYFKIVESHIPTNKDVIKPEYSKKPPDTAPVSHMSDISQNNKTFINKNFSDLEPVSYGTDCNYNQNNEPFITSFGWNRGNNRSTGVKSVEHNSFFTLLWKYSGDISSCTGVENYIYFTSCNNIYAISLGKGRLEKWNYKASDRICYIPLITGDYIYFADKGGNLTCCNRLKGNGVWKSRVPGDGIRSPLCSDRDLIFFISNNSKLYGIDIHKGDKIKWFFNLDSGPITPLNIKDGHLFTGNTSGITMLNSSTGYVVWEKKLQGHMTKFPPSITENYLFSIRQIDDREFIFALDISSQKVTWKKEMEGRVSFHIISVKDRIFVVLSDRINCYKIDNGDLLWSHETGEVRVSLSCHQGFLYYFDSMGVFKIINSITGEVIKTRNLDMKLVSPIFVSGGVVYLPGQGGQIYGWTDPGVINDKSFNTIPVPAENTFNQEQVRTIATCAENSPSCSAVDEVTVDSQMYRRKTFIKDIDPGELSGYGERISDNSSPFSLEEVKTDISDGIPRVPVREVRPPSIQPFLNSVNCPDCGFVVRSEAKFCPKCRFRLLYPCPNCGDIVRGEAKFCAKCGYNLR